MAKKNKVTKKQKPTEASKPVEVYEYTSAKRLNNPQVGLVNTKTEKEEKKKVFNYDPHLDPSLEWAGKKERTSFEIPTVSLHVHEKIDPRTIIEAVKKSPEKIWHQLNLFNRPINKLTFIKEIEFYKHEKDWSNRLISGDSLLVMNSLIEKENLAGKVQMVYFDPPYGIRYKSNFQPFTGSKNVDGSDKDIDLPTEPETIRAFRDTWELGLHSYLSFIRDRAMLSKELLKDSGSIFIQISDENQHLIRIILDEIFGSNNFVALIPFRKKTMPLGATHLERMHDFIIWYAKDIKKLKYNQLYEEKDYQGDFHWAWAELPSGERIKMSAEQINNHSLLPEGSKIFRLVSMWPPSFDPKSVFSVEFQGKKWAPPEGACYPTNIDGMEKLKNAKRLHPEGQYLRYVWFLDEAKFAKMTASWPDTIGARDPIYVVQTSEEVVKRCLLMSTEPGDLILDPTCGSGTTAVVAEDFGRRWITCDSSRVAIALAKKRLMTSTFDYYQTRELTNNVDSGFIYSTFESFRLKNVVSGEPGTKIDLINKPLVDSKKVRVTGPFTVEAVPAPVVKDFSSSETNNNSLNGPNDWILELAKSGVRAKNKLQIKFSRLELLSGTRWLHAEGSTLEETPQRVVISFGPDFAPLEQRQVEYAIQEAEKMKPSPTIIIFAAFQFDPEAAKDIDEIEWGGVTILKVQMNADLFTDDLRKKKTGNESFWLIGQPDIKIERIKQSDSSRKFHVIVKGFDYYNPKTGGVESGGADKIAMWMLDNDYDGRSLMPKQVFFPMSGGKDGWSKLAKTLKNEIDEDLIEAYRGTTSLPFEIGENKKIAVKIIDDRGIESLIIQDIES